SASLHSVWAEDGSIFLRGALTEGFAGNVFAPYANYLVLVPRLIGEAAMLVPLDDASVVVSVLSAAMVSGCGIAVWYASGSHIESLGLRAALAVVAVLVPVS